MTVPKLANLTKLHIAVVGLLLTLTLALAPAMQASAYTDGLSYVNCTGRTNWGTVNIDAGFGVTGTVTAYRCTNGYFYVVTKSTARANTMVASIQRSNPFGQSIKSGNNTFQVITDMLAQLNGACYDVWGSINSTGKGWRFCW